MAHQHYKGTGQMHSFRGLLADGEQRKIRIEGATGEIAWRITKFQLMPHNLNSNQEACVKVFREKQTALVFDFDFDNGELLAAAYFTAPSAADTHSEDTTIVFDNALFSRNLYITHENNASGVGINYYLELEEVKVSAAGMAQLAVAAARRT